MKKNILIVVNSLKVGGGAERIAAQLGTYLNQNGYKATFLARYDTEKKYSFEGEYLYVHETRDKNKLIKFFRELKTPKKISKVSKEKNIDTVISFTPLPNICTILSKIIFGNSCNIITSVRNNPLKHRKIYQFQIRIFYPEADKVVALSKGVENKLKDNFLLENTTFIHNIQNIEKFNKLAEKDILDSHESLFDGNDFIFITIGSPRKQKGQWYLLRSLKKVLEYEDKVKLVLLGDGNLKKRLEELAKDLNIKGKVFFLGNIENVFPYLQKADCFVFPSLWEGFGNVLTEALSQDLPVISTDCLAGPREILCPELEIDEEIYYPYYGEYGILTETFKDRLVFKTLEEEPLSKKERMFAKTIIEIINNQELKSRYSDVSERVRDFEVDKIIQKWEKLL